MVSVIPNGKNSVCRAGNGVILSKQYMCGVALASFGSVRIRAINDDQLDDLRRQQIRQQGAIARNTGFRAEHYGGRQQHRRVFRAAPPGITRGKNGRTAKRNHGTGAARLPQCLKKIRPLQAHPRSSINVKALRSVGSGVRLFITFITLLCLNGL